MSAPDKLVKLRTGKEVPELMVRVLMISLNSLVNIDPIAFYELVMVARDPNHQPWGKTGEYLEAYGLLQGGEIYHIYRDIIIAATEGEEVDLAIVDPLAS